MASPSITDGQASISFSLTYAGRHPGALGILFLLGNNRPEDVTGMEGGDEAVLEEVEVKDRRERRGGRKEGRKEGGY